MKRSTKPPFHPTLGRLGLGLAFGACLPALFVVSCCIAVLGVGGAILATAFTFTYVLGAVVVFGLPALWLMRGRDPSSATTALLGAFVASAPCMVGALFGGPDALIASVTMILLLSVPLGALGGMIFGAVALARPPPPRAP